MYYLKAFFNSFKIDWLQKQKNEGKKAANYIILFVLLFSAIYAGYFANRIPEELTKVRDEVFLQVPDFGADMVGGQLTVTDLEQPFVFESEAGEEPFKLVVDTVNTTTASIEDVMKDESVSTVLITKTQVSIHDASVGKTTIQQFSDFPDISSSKQELLAWSNDFLSKKTTFFVFLLIAWFVIFTMSRVVYSLLLSLIVFVVAHFAKREEWKFGQIYTVSLFAVTAPTIIGSFVALAGVHVPYLYTVLTLGLLLVVVFYKKQGIGDDKGMVEEDKK
ncbi:DUF1189 family protein [Candidatus Parcubacteria bacterium]|jgi:hypothetical protein|nr:DUF1189 family protein [Candidatus Parcubacteria bacterium]MBT3949176.1 DUF1189 family protein [Candidatus Parcubacteria bacterium]